MQLQALRNDELLRHALAEIDDLTSSELERELLRRFEKLHDEHEQLQNTLGVLVIDFDLDIRKTKDIERVRAALKFEQDFDLQNAGALMAALLEADIDDPKTLRKSLKAHAEFEDLMNDLAEPLARLHALSNPATTKEA